MSPIFHACWDAGRALSSCNLESPDSLVKSNAFMVGAYVEDELAGIGAIKIVTDYAELKRMYVEYKYRGLKKPSF